jgi:hypothetical protein
LEVRLEELVNGAEAERADVQTLSSASRDRLRELRPLSTSAEASGEQEENRLLVHTPKREGKRARRGRIEPLDVVDGDDNGPFGSQNLQRAADSDAEGARIEAFRLVLDEERDLERPSSRWGQRGQNVVEHTLEQVAEHHIGESLLRLDWPRRQDAQSSLTSGLDACKPERRLSDPHLALEHKRAGPSGGTLEEGV